jgi:hypothetical protein
VKDNPPKTLKRLFDLDDSNTFSVYEFYIFWVFHDGRLLLLLKLAFQSSKISLRNLRSLKCHPAQACTRATFTSDKLL